MRRWGVEGTALTGAGMAAPQSVVIVTQTQDVISPDTKSVLLANTGSEEKSLKLTALLEVFTAFLFF